LRAEVSIGAPASAVWKVVGERFGSIGDWAAPITSSSLDGQPNVGAVRTCHIARFGPVPPGIVKERLVAFDPAAMTLVYQPIGGMPSSVRRAINRWSVIPDGDECCVIRSCATLELQGVLARLSWLLRRWIAADGRPGELSFVAPPMAV